MADRTLYVSSLVGGGTAGIVVDVVLFPLDTLKTRLQSAQGFAKSGGFKGIYKGIGPQTLGSIPQAALFFCSYESIKANTLPHVPKYCEPLVYMGGASVSEVIACVIRVPMEVVKQRRQTQISSKSSSAIALEAIQAEGIKGMYRGFWSTVLREVPFSFIQFPILEYLKKLYSAKLKNGNTLESWEVAICGSVAGGTSAAITTPLDVVKTRIMLASVSENAKLTVLSVMQNVYRERGIGGLFAGFVPRVTWITMGGFIFFGMYDFSKNLCRTYLEYQSK